MIFRIIWITHQDHPHMRGEYTVQERTNATLRGSPPHAWGIQLDDGHGHITYRITPTCVGNTPRVLSKFGLIKDHPHMRGEYLYGKEFEFKPQGSPPHAWGIPIRLAERFLFCQDHPHMRGEYKSRHGTQSKLKGSPPHAWGIPYGRNNHLMEKRITPTCVGNTSERFQLA